MKKPWTSWVSITAVSLAVVAILALDTWVEIQTRLAQEQTQAGGDATSLRGMGWTECRNCDPQEP